MADEVAQRGLTGVFDLAVFYSLFKIGRKEADGRRLRQTENFHYLESVDRITASAFGILNTDFLELFFYEVKVVEKTLFFSSFLLVMSARARIIRSSRSSSA